MKNEEQVTTKDEEQVTASKGKRSIFNIAAIILLVAIGLSAIGMFASIAIAFSGYCQPSRRNIDDVINRTNAVIDCTIPNGVYKRATEFYIDIIYVHDSYITFIELNKESACVNYLLYDNIITDVVEPPKTIEHKYYLSYSDSTLTVSKENELLSFSGDYEYDPLYQKGDN